MAENIKTETELRELKTIDPQSVYMPANLQGWTHDRDVGYPGEFPFTRDVQPTMYRGRLWINRLARAAVLSPRIASGLLPIAKISPAVLQLLTGKIVRRR